MPAAWYHATRATFLGATLETIAGELALCANAESLSVEAEQTEEWLRSVEVLQQNLQDGIPILRQALQAPGNEAIRDVILEYDFRRRGLRMDCVLLADGVVFVIEFKRSQLGRADRDQVMGYAVNLIEFHEVTRGWTEQAAGIVAPILVRTTGRLPEAPTWPGFNSGHWTAMADSPLEADAHSLGNALSTVLANRRGTTHTPAATWLASPFAPSSSIVDATVSLFLESRRRSDRRACRTT
jgi:hypothetical protein